MGGSHIGHINFRDFLSDSKEAHQQKEDTVILQKQIEMQKSFRIIIVFCFIFSNMSAYRTKIKEHTHIIITHAYDYFLGKIFYSPLF